jgi:hypothetical protein
MKKESTNSGGNDDTPSTSSSSKPKDIIHDDVCSICFEDVSMLDIDTFFRCSQCSKVIHMKCGMQLVGTKGLSYETRNSCPMCRTPIVPEGSKEHIERLQRWLKRNRSWAQFGLGCLYDQGLGVKKDLKRAGELYKLAADQGHHSAQFNLGLMYAKGVGVIQSETLAFKYYQLSAIQGYANAQSSVGLYYAKGKGVKHSLTKATEWWTKAAKQGDEAAITNLKMLDEMADEMLGIKTTSSSNFTDNSTGETKEEPYMCVDVD